MTLLLFLLLDVASSLRRSDLFPFGSRSGDSRLPADTEDVSSPEVALGVNVKFFGRDYESIFVSAFGNTDIGN